MGAAESKSSSGDVCMACGAVVAGAKAGCLQMFEETIAKEFSDYRYGRIHRLTVDAYSLQHPEDYMLSGKSFAAHLTGVCAALEYEDALAINRVVQKWLSKNPNINKPTRLPGQRGKITIPYVHSARDPEEHARRVLEWARDVWGAWSEHHDLARRLIKEAAGEINKG